MSSKGSAAAQQLKSLVSDGVGAGCVLHSKSGVSDPSNGA